MRPAIYRPPTDALQKLDQLYDVGYRYRLRNMSLQLAHSAQLEKFINVEESFGASRMRPPSPEYAKRVNSPPVRFPDMKLVCTDDQLAALASPLLAPAGAGPNLTIPRHW